MRTYNELLPNLWFHAKINEPPRMLIYNNFVFIRDIKPEDVSPEFLASMLELTKDKTIIVIPTYEFNYFWEQACEQTYKTGIEHYEHMLIALTMHKLEGSPELDPDGEL